MKKFSKLLVAILVLSMFTWTLAGCGSGSGDTGNEEKAAKADEGLYTASEVSSDLSMAKDVKAFYDAIDMDYAYDLSYELAYNWDDLADHLGWRSAGSDSEHACADYLVKEFEKIGLQNVDKLGSKCDRFQFNDSSLKIKGTDIDLEPASYQVNGTDGDLTAEIVNCGTGFWYDYEGKDVKDKIVLVQVDQYNESWIDGYISQAHKEGAAALVTWAKSGYGELNADTVNVQDVCSADLLPTAAISANEAKAIKKAIKAGNNECTLNIDAELSVGNGTTYNVVGMIPGKNHDQRIIISGHYDKYWYGFQDDCCAIGLVAAVAKAMVKQGYEPENDIYFVCHGAEEWGVTDCMFDWTTGAWGMCEEHSEFADNTIAMLNCELPAFKTKDNTTMVAVPEFFSLIGDMFDSGLIVTQGDTAFVKKPVPADNMEDGISYRWHGVPYVINGFQDEKFICDRYHTIEDDESTYDADIFKTNIGWYGAYAMYLDKEPALSLDLTASVDQLEKNFNADFAKEAGVDCDAYQEALDGLRTAAEDLKGQVDACNKKYEKAAADGDEETMAAAREEGLALNKKSLEAFQMIQDEFQKVNDYEVTYGHKQINTNVELLDGVVAGLDAGEVWAEDEESGAGDCCWQINGELEYDYAHFDVDLCEETLSAYTTEYYTDKNHGQWGYGKLVPTVYISETAYQLMNAETIDDVDVKACKEEIKAARAKCIEDIGTYSAAEIEAMNNITAMLAQ